MILNRISLWRFHGRDLTHDWYIGASNWLTIDCSRFLHSKRAYQIEISSSTELVNSFQMTNLFISIFMITADLWCKQMEISILFVWFAVKKMKRLVWPNKRQCQSAESTSSVCPRNSPTNLYNEQIIQCEWSRDQALGWWKQQENVRKLHCSSSFMLMTVYLLHSIMLTTVERQPSDSRCTSRLSGSSVHTALQLAAVTTPLLMNDRIFGVCSWKWIITR